MFTTSHLFGSIRHFVICELLLITSIVSFQGASERSESSRLDYNNTRLSIEARPVTVETKNITNLDGQKARQQVTYSNIFATRNAVKDCSSSWADIHGHVSVDDKLTMFECPKGGVIIAFKYKYSKVQQNGKAIHFIKSITFTCSSSLGYTHQGPFGKGGEYEQYKFCGTKHISYITGIEDDFLVNLDNVCVESGVPPNDQASSSIEGEDDVFTEEGKILKKFSDECFATKGRRPNRIKVYTAKRNGHLTGIQIEYVNKPVALRCKVTQIELLGNDTLPELVAYEVLGITAGSTCSLLPQELCLTVIQSESQSVTNATSTTNGGSTSGTKAKNIAAGFWYYVGTELVVGVIGGKSLGMEASDTESNGKTVVKDKSQKATINYEGPGAAIVAGYRRIYRIRSDKTKVLYRYTCEAGSSTPPTEGEINITGNIYGNVHFHDYHFPFGNETERKCTTKLRECISKIKLDKTVQLPRLLETKLRSEVDKCFIED